MNTFKKILVTIQFLILLSPVALFAQTPVQNIVGESLANTANQTGVQTTTSIPTLVGNIINSLFALVGIVFLGMSIIGGILWMMAGGSEEKVHRAKGFIIGGINGLIIMFMAYAMVYFVLQALNQGVSN